jgi:hypothetical protein
MIEGRLQDHQIVTAILINATSPGFAERVRAQSSIVHDACGCESALDNPACPLPVERPALTLTIAFST